MPMDDREMGERSDETLFLGRMEDIRGVVDDVLAGGPTTLLDLKRRLAGELAFDPKPQALQALSALRDVSDVTARQIGSRAAILHLAVDRSMFELWESPDVSDAALDRGIAMVEPLLSLREEVEAAFEETIGTVDRTERDTIGKLHASLRLSEEPLLAAVLVVPELAKLRAAARDGSLAEAAPSLTPYEHEVIASTASDTETSRFDRVVLDAIALRTAMERETRAFSVESTAEPDGRPARDALRLAHGIVSPRLDALRAELFTQTKKSNATLDEERRKLFAAYLGLSQSLAGHPAEIEASVQEQILEAELTGAAVDRAKSSREELLRDAATGGERPAPVAVELPPDMQDVIRERRRKRILIGIVAGLVPVALTANLLTFAHRTVAPTTASDFVASSVPVQEVVPVGPMLYCQVATVLWADLSDAEKAQKVTGLGKFAAQRGFRALIVVDENRRELAWWTADGGAKVVPKSSTQP